MTNSMFAAMNTVAARSWNLMTTGISQGIGPGEETLTDLNLILLKQMIPSMLVTKFTKPVEATNGADWEWWIGSSAEELWFRLRIQAKRSGHDGSKPNGVRYEHVDHPSAGSTRQYDTLILKSLKLGAIPFHVFFNGWPAERYAIEGPYRHDQWACLIRAYASGFLPNARLWNALNWGCTMAPSEVVKRICEDPSTADFVHKAPNDRKASLDSLYVPRYLSHSTPWAYLFHSDIPGQGPTVREIAQNVHRMRGLTGDLSDDDFSAMTSPNPSKEAEEAAYGPGRVTMRKYVAAADRERNELRHQLNWDRMIDFYESIGSPAGLGQILDGEEDELSGPGYRMLTDLTPEANPQLTYGLSPRT